MKILILNGNPDVNNIKFDDYIKDIDYLLRGKGHNVTISVLRDKNIEYCCGCFGCWVKTPGECVIYDDSLDICKQYINSDWVIFASPIIMGFTSTLLKKTQDRLIPLIHPYFEIVSGECQQFSVKRN